jgi:RNA polymerase sigma factor (sigma-70 family)
VKLHLKMPQASLNAMAVDKSIVNVFGAAFKKLFRSVSELKVTLRSNEEEKNKRTATENSLADIVPPEAARKMLAEFYSSNYGKFYNYALREIRFRSYQGYSEPGDIEVADVLDEALLTAGEQLTHEFNEEKAVRICFDEIRKAIERHLKTGGMALVPIEEAIEPEDIAVDYQEYYQPDEVIKVEDILIDPDTITPGQEIVYKEIETYIDKVLAQLPADWRDAFILSVREDVPITDIAHNRGTTDSDIQQEIETARSFISRKLTDSGFDWKE